MSAMKLGHSPSLRRKCFKRCQLDPHHSESADPVPNTLRNLSTPTFSVEDTDSNVLSKRERKSGSVTVSTPIDEVGSSLHLTLRHQSSSTSSLDSGVSLSRASSSSSLSQSKRSSKDNSNPGDIASPPFESKRLASIDELLTEASGNTGTDDQGEDCSNNLKVITDKSNTSILLDRDDAIGSNTDEDYLTTHMKRVSISMEALEDLLIAVNKVVANANQQSEAGQGALNQKAKQLHISNSLPPLATEKDGSWHDSVRRHSSADPYIPLTQPLKRQAERKRSAQPSFHRSSVSESEEDNGRNNGRMRKTSACIMCGRKQRESTRSAPSVYIKMPAMIPGHQKKRRFSETLKVYKPKELPFTELRPLNVAELSQILRNRMDRTTRQPLSKKRPLSRPEFDVVRDQQLRHILESNMPKFLQYTDWDGLFAHLVSKGLLNSEHREILLCKMRTSIDKGNYFYGQELPKLGIESMAYIKLYECLDETKEQYRGHNTLVNILRESLQTYYHDRYCQLCGQLSETKKQ